MEPTAVLALVYQDGSVSRMQFFGKPTDAEIQKAVDKSNFSSVPVSSWRRVSLSDFESTEGYNGAWRDTGARIVIDMPKARDIQRCRLRIMRAPLLAALDVEYQRADESGDVQKKLAIVARKQQLRDATRDPRIDAAQTPEQLKDVVLK